jgi:hypothetical protein
MAGGGEAGGGGASGGNAGGGGGNGHQHQHFDFGELTTGAGSHTGSSNPVVRTVADMVNLLETDVHHHVTPVHDHIM